MSQNPQSQTSPPPVVSKSRLRKFLLPALVLTAIALAAIATILHVGKQQTHSFDHHPLYISFNTSKPHSKLLNDLRKSKLSILTGADKKGFNHFLTFYANHLSQSGRTVYVEDNQKGLFGLETYAQKARQSITGFPSGGDWIVFSSGSQVPLDLVQKIQTSSPDSKITVVSSDKLKIKGFKVFNFPELERQIFTKSLIQHFNLKANAALAFSEHFQTPESWFSEDLDTDALNFQSLLGEDYVPIDGVSKEQANLLKSLCAKGVGSVKKDSENLKRLGTVFYKGKLYWNSSNNILNYQLRSNKNCKNTVVSQNILKEILAEQKKQEAGKQAQAAPAQPSESSECGKNDKKCQQKNKK